jgi:membrane protein implicated in regulation of membrane protease activity
MNLILILAFLVVAVGFFFFGAWFGRFFTRYPFGQKSVTGKEGMLSKVATVEKKVSDHYEVRIDSQVWRAYCDKPLNAGEKVVVTDINGNKLTVEKINK